MRVYDTHLKWVTTSVSSVEFRSGFRKGFWVENSLINIFLKMKSTSRFLISTADWCIDHTPRWIFTYSFRGPLFLFLQTIRSSNSNVFGTIVTDFGRFDCGGGFFYSSLCTCQWNISCHYITSHNWNIFPKLT